MISAGTLEWRIVIERNYPTLDIDGSPIDNWNRLGRLRWARRYHLDGEERYTSDQYVSREQVGFVIRWTKDLADLSPKERVIYPVRTAPTDNEIYDIIGIEEMGWREGIRIITTRRSET